MAKLPRHAPLEPARMRWLLALFFCALAIPAVVLIVQAHGQLELDAFRRQQLLADEIYRRIDNSLAAAVQAEDARPVDAYRFASGAGGSRSAVQRSALSAYPPPRSVPGVIGYFEVDAEGALSTPLLPDGDFDPNDHGMPAPELDARRALRDRLFAVLARNRLVGMGRAVVPERLAFSDAPRARGQAEFDRLAETLPPVRPASAQRRARAGPTDTAAEDARSAEAPEADPAATVGADADRAAKEAGETEQATGFIATFQSELEPLRFNRLDTGQFVLFRNAWRDGARFVQGALVDQHEFLDAAIESHFRSGGLAPGSGLIVASGAGELLRLDRPDAEAGSAPLHAARLSPPFGALELTFLAGDLPRGPAHDVLVWTAVVLFSVLTGGFIAMYRFGVQQIRLARQQRNFVAAVSHELKTPLTSIRLYAEMLKSGWTTEEKKQAYYGFIFAEGERLSRLIDNVLRLARLDRGAAVVALEALTVREALDMMRSKVAAQAEQAAMELGVELDPAVASATVDVDPDALAQVFINLVDNAIKFAQDAERREIVLFACGVSAGQVVFGVRDFGPGLPRGDMKRLFQLFYRPDDERTRSTAGTGIGLALVRQLVAAMHGTVDVRNRDPGAEFRITFHRGERDG